MIKFQYSFRSINSNIKINDLNCQGKTLLVWQYCGIPKNERNFSQPKALIAFRELVSASQFSTTIIYRKIPITCLGQIRLGSLCKDNRVIAYANFEKRTFQLNFHQNHWRFISFYASKLDHLEQPYPMGLYPLSYKYDRSWFVEFGVSNNYCKRLVIPSLEFFTRCYGHSGELRRTLMTYPWNGPNGVISRLIPPINEPEDERVWKIKVGKRLNNGDTVFLAHLKYDSYTQTQAKLIYSQIEAGDSYNGLTFPKIGPWFEGPVQLTVRGIPFDSGQSFLGFQIQGISEPQGVDIIKIRDKEMMHGQGELSNNSQNIPIKTTSSQSDFLNITSDNDPDHGIHSIEIDDPEIIIIGNKRTIFNNYEVRASGSWTDLSCNSDSIDQFSTGEPYRSGKDTGQLLTNIPVVLESEGALRDMWKAAKLLQEKYRSIVHSVHWYSPINGFIDSDEPELVSLEPFTEEEIIRDLSITP